MEKQNPAIQDRDSGFKGIFGTTGNGCFIATDIIISVLLFGILAIWCSLWLIIVLAVCICNSLGLETFGTIKKNRIAMIAAVVLTVILFGLFVFYSAICSGFNFGAFIVCLILAIWNLARFIFQIKVIQWIRDNRNIPLLPQTSNGYQSI